METDNTTKRITGIVGQLAVISVLVLLYVIVSFTYRYEYMTPQETLKKGLLIGAGIAAIAIITTYLIRKPQKIKSSISVIKNNKMIILVLVIATLLRVFSLDAMQRWDAGEYYIALYDAVQSFQFSLAQFLADFQLCSHPTLAYAFIYSIGEFAFHGQVIGVMLVNLVLTIIALGCVYAIIRKLFYGVSNTMAAVYTLIISVTPLFLGTFGYVNLDYALALFTIYAICGYLYQKNILLLFSCCCMVQTKETGLILVAGLFAGICFEKLIRFRNKRFIHVILTSVSVYAVGIALIIQCVFMKMIGGVSNWATPNEHSASIFRWSNNGSNCFGFNLDYIVTKCKQYFIFNFNWIFSGLIIVGILFIIVSVARKRKVHIPHEFIMILTTLFAFWLFSCFYITAMLDRYNVISCLLWCFFALWCVHTMGNVAVAQNTQSDDKKIEVLEAACTSVGGRRSNLILTLKIVKCLACACITTVLLIQSYVTIDPVTKSLFQVKSTGTSEIVYAGSSNRVIPIMNDYMVYNNQYTFLDRAIDAMLQDVEYNDNMDIFVFTEEIQLRIEGNPKVYDIYWDKVAKKRVLCCNKNTIAFQIIEQENMFRTDIDFHEDAICFFVPFYRITEQRGLEIASKIYDIGERGQYTSAQGSMSYYRLKYKNAVAANATEQ